MFTGIAKVLRGLEDKMARTKMAQMSINIAITELKHKTWQAQHEWAYSEILHGEIKLEAHMRLDMIDEPTIALAKKNTMSNFTKISKLETIVRKRLKQHEAEKDLEPAVSKNFERCDAKSLRDFLRETKADEMAGTKKDIAKYIAATLFAGDDTVHADTEAAQVEADHAGMRKKRTECVAFLNTEFAARWQMINDKKDKKGNAVVLKKTTKVMKQHNCTNVQRREIVRWAVSRCVDKYANDKDANGKGKDVATIMKARQGSVKSTRATAAIDEDGDANDTPPKIKEMDREQEIAKVIDSMKKQKRRYSERAVKEMEYGMREVDKVAGEARDKEDKLPVENLQERPIEPCEGIDEDVWTASFKDFYNVFGLDEYPEIKLTGVPACDFVCIRLGTYFAEITHALNTTYRSKAAFIIAVRKATPKPESEYIFTCGEAILQLMRLIEAANGKGNSGEKIALHFKGTEDSVFVYKDNHKSKKIGHTVAASKRADDVVTNGSLNADLIDHSLLKAVAAFMDLVYVHGTPLVRKDAEDAKEKLEKLTKGACRVILC